MFVSIPAGLSVVSEMLRIDQLFSIMLRCLFSAEKLDDVDDKFGKRKGDPTG